MTPSTAPRAIEQRGSRTGAGAALPGSTAASAGARGCGASELEAIGSAATGVLQEVTAATRRRSSSSPARRTHPSGGACTAPRLTLRVRRAGRARLAPRAGSGARAARAARAARGADGRAARSREGDAGAPRRERDVRRRARPGTGEPKGRRVPGAVEFTEPGRKAWASRSSYDGAAAKLVLTGDPRSSTRARAATLKRARRSRSARARATFGARQRAAQHRPQDGRQAGRHARRRAGDAHRLPRLLSTTPRRARPATGRMRCCAPATDEVRAPLDHARGAGAGQAAPDRERRYDFAPAPAPEPRTRPGRRRRSTPAARRWSTRRPEPRRLQGRRRDPPGRHR